MRTPCSRASSPSKTAAGAASAENTERRQLPTPRSPTVRDPQIPIGARQTVPFPPRGFLLGEIESRMMCKKYSLSQLLAQQAQRRCLASVPIMESSTQQPFASGCPSQWRTAQHISRLRTSTRTMPRLCVFAIPCMLDSIAPSLSGALPLRVYGIMIPRRQRRKRSVALR